MKTHSRRSAWAAAAALALSAATSQATLQVYEGFSYTPSGGYLVGSTYNAGNSCSGGTGFGYQWVNPIPTAYGSTYVRGRVAASGMTYPSGVNLTPVGSNWRVLRAENAAMYGEAFGARLLSTSYDFGGESTFYISMLMRNNPNNPDGYFLVSLAKSSLASNQLYMGITGSRKARFGFGYSGYSGESVDYLDTNGVYFLVGKVVTHAGSANDEYYMNYYHVVSNSVPTAEPCTWSISYRTNLANLAVDSIGVIGGQLGYGDIQESYLDEIRIGTTWTDVTGNSAPSAAITFNNLTQTYNGATHPVTASTTPGGLSVTITYPGGSAPIAAGSYTVTGKVCDASYQGTATDTLVVNKATPTVSVLPTASGITYGQALSASTLSGGTASVPGTFAFTTPATVPNAGTAAQSVTFTPTASANYSSVVVSVNVSVSKVTPTITTPPTASAISYGQSLASSTLSGGAASTAGSFAFTTPATTPEVGTASQSVTFTPTDSGNYNTASTTASVTVNKVVPTITTPPTAATINYGQTLAAAALSGGAASVAGAFAFTTPATAPGAGTASQSVTFTPTDSAHNETVTFSVSVTVNKVTPTITTAPTASTIIGGQPLSDSSLTGGAASVPGSFAFTAPASVPAVGTASQSVTFTPTDSANYESVILAVTVVVQPNLPPVLAAVGDHVTTVGTPLTFTVLVSDGNGTYPTLSARGKPAAASFTPGVSGTNSSGTFSWTPQADDYGVHPIRFEATDGAATDWEIARVYVGLAGETNCSGIPCSLQGWAPPITNIVAATSNTSARVVWNDLDGIFYNLYYSTNPFTASPNWSMIASAVQGNGGTNQQVDNGIGSSLRRFYRLALTGDSPTTNHVWGVIRRDVPGNSYTLISPPLRTDNRFDGDMGRMLAEQLTGSDDGLGDAGDEVYILQSNGSWRSLYLDESKTWRESNGSASTYQLAPGQGMVLRRESASPARITFSGEVGNDSTRTNRLNTGWNIVGLSEGKSLKVTETFASANPVGAAAEEDADIVAIQNSNGSWRRMMYISGWGAPYDGKWFDLSTFQIATNTLDPGAASYYYRQSSGGNANVRY